MKIHKQVITLGCAAALTACSSKTPDCAAPETIDVLSSIVDGYVSKTVAEFNKRNNVEFSAEVPYSFSAMRTLDYDEASDSYQCEATVQADIEVKWAGPTNLQVTNRQNSRFGYRVYSVFDADGNRSTEIEYEMIGLMGVPSSTATGLLEQQFAAIRTERANDLARAEKAEYSDAALVRLEEIRNNGIWLEEFEIVEKMLRSEVHIPEPTQKQVSMRDYGDMTRGSPAHCALVASNQEGACAYMSEKYGAERQKWLQHEAELVVARFQIDQCSAAKLRPHGSYLPAMRTQIAYEKECRDVIAPLHAEKHDVTALDQCVEERVAALRREIGDEAAIRFDQLEEFETQCAGG